MTRTTIGIALLAAVTCLAASGCALLGKSQPVQIRYFSPEAISAPSASNPRPTSGQAPAQAPASTATTSTAELQLRLGRVTPAAYLRESIAYRDATSEVGFYSKLRWAEPPEAYVRRGLARALFEKHSVREIVSGTGPTLEIDLHAFEEMRQPRHAARIALTWRVRDGRTVIAQRTVTIEQPLRLTSHDIPPDKAPEIVAAMTDALTATVDDVVGNVVNVLTQHRTATAASTAAAP